MVNEEKDYLTAFVRERGFACYPNEACGLIYADEDDKPVYVECKNVSDDPHNQFLIDPNEFLEVEKKGKIVGCWHTHCDIPPTASEADKQGCINTNVPWFIGSVYKNEDGAMSFKGLKQVMPDNGYVAPLIGRPYTFGVFDCFSLVRDYYKQTFGIEARDVPRRERCWEEEENFMESRAPSYFGMVRLPDGTQPIVGDVFLIQTGTHGSDHIAVYIGNDRILHQMRNRLSRTDIYGGSYWQEHTISHWRHKSKCSQK